MQRADIDVGAARLAEPDVPAGPQAWDQPPELGATKWFHGDGGAAERAQLRTEVLFPFFARNVNGAAGAKERAIMKFGRRMRQESSRSGGERLDERPAIAFGPEGRRPAGRMVAGCASASRSRTEAEPAISAARLAPAIPAPTITTSAFIRAREFPEKDRSAQAPPCGRDQSHAGVHGQPAGTSPAPPSAGLRLPSGSPLR